MRFFASKAIVLPSAKPSRPKPKGSARSSPSPTLPIAAMISPVAIQPIRPLPSKTIEIGASATSKVEGTSRAIM